MPNTETEITISGLSNVININDSDKFIFSRVDAGQEATYNINFSDISKATLNSFGYSDGKFLSTVSDYFREFGNELTINTVNIQNDAVTSSKIANGNITTDKLADSAINTAKLSNESVTSVKIANKTITNDKLADNTIENTKIAENAEIAQSKLDINFQNAENTELSTSKILLNTATDSFNINTATIKQCDVVDLTAVLNRNNNGLKISTLTLNNVNGGPAPIINSNTITLSTDVDYNFDKNIVALEIYPVFPSTELTSTCYYTNLANIIPADVIYWTLSVQAWDYDDIISNKNNATNNNSYFKTDKGEMPILGVGGDNLSSSHYTQRPHLITWITNKRNIVVPINYKKTLLKLSNYAYYKDINSKLVTSTTKVNYPLINYINFRFYYY